MWPLPVTVALALEWAVLLAFAIGWLWSSRVFSVPIARAVLIVLAASAMGVQSASVRRLGRCDDLSHRDTDDLGHTVRRVSIPSEDVRCHTPPGGGGLSRTAPAVGTQRGLAGYRMARLPRRGRRGRRCAVAGTCVCPGPPARPASHRSRRSSRCFLAAVVRSLPPQAAEP